MPFFDGTRILEVPNFSWGNRVVSANNSGRGAPPNINFPGFLNINTTQDVVVSLTKVMGRHTLKPGSTTATASSARTTSGAADNFGTLNFSERHGRHQPVRHVVRVRQCGDRQLQLVRAGVAYVEGQLQLQQHRGLHSGQLEGEQASSRSTTACASCMRSRSTTACCRAAISCRTSGLSRRRRGCMSRAARTACIPAPGTNRQAHESDHGRSSSDRTARWPSARSCRTPAT